MNFITQFIKGNWLGKARLYTFNPRKMKVLLLQLGFYLTKNGLSSAKETLILIRDYLHDVSTGKYKDYELKKLTIIVGAIIYVVTPVDLLPDFVGVLFLFYSIQKHKCTTEAEDKIKPLFLVLAVDYFVHWIFAFNVSLESLIINVISIYAMYILLGEVANRIREKQPECAGKLEFVRKCNVMLQTVVFLVSAYEYEALNGMLVVSSLVMLIAMLVVVCKIEAEEQSGFEVRKHGS